jgi:uncharacterized membrane protein
MVLPSDARIARSLLAVPPAAASRTVQELLGAAESGTILKRVDSLVLLTVLVVSAGYAAVVGALALLRYEVFASDFDHGLFSQYVWLLGHLRDPFATVDLRTMLGDHVEPGLALLAPLGAVDASAAGVLVVQALALALTAPLLYRLSRTYGATGWAAAACPLLWCVSPIVLRPALQDFHPESLVPPVLMAGCLALAKQRTGWFLASAVLACSFREDVALTYAGLGVLLIWTGRRRLGAVLAGAAIAWAAVAAYVVMPHFGNAGEQEYGPRFAGYRGDSFADAARYMVLHPLATIDSALTPNDIGIVVMLIATTAGLCLLAPRWLLVAAPATTFNLLSADELQHTIQYHYWIVAAAAVAVAGAVGAGRVSADAARFWARIAGVTGVLLFLLSLQWGKAIVDQIRYEWPRRADRQGVLAAIPPGASVAASTHALAHLADRAEIYALPEPFVAVRSGTRWGASDRRRASRQLEYAVFDPGLRFWGSLTDAEVEQAIVSNGFHLVLQRGQTRLYQRESRG